MSTLPLARVTMRHALQQGTNLILYVEGLTSGFGGALIIEQSPTDEFPPVFEVRENPGNTGINPNASPTDVPTKAAYAFLVPGQLEEVTLIDASGRATVFIVRVETETGSETTSMTDPQPSNTGPGNAGGGTPHSGETNGQGSCGAGTECEWSAIHDFMPPRPARLRVNGTCLMPTPGYKLSLSPAIPQGINPNILLLELTVEAPGGNVPQVRTPAPVAYEEVTDRPYTQVTIVPDGPTIDVQDVH